MMTIKHRIFQLEFDPPLAGNIRVCWVITKKALPQRVVHFPDNNGRWQPSSGINEHCAASTTKLQDTEQRHWIFKLTFGRSDSQTASFSRGPAGVLAGGVDEPLCGPVKTALPGVRGHLTVRQVLQRWGAASNVFFLKRTGTHASTYTAGAPPSMTSRADWPPVGTPFGTSIPT